MKQRFLEEIYEIAFGDNAINKNYSTEEVLARLREFSDKALYVDQCILEDNDFAMDKYVHWLKEEKR